MTSAPCESCQNPLSSRFVIATGIECSYPTISDALGRRVRVDQLEQTFHYRYWREDLALVKSAALDLGRQPRPVATAYKELIHRFAAEPLLPYGSLLGFTADRARREEARSPGVFMEVEHEGVA